MSLINNNSPQQVVSPSSGGATEVTTGLASGSVTFVTATGLLSGSSDKVAIQAPSGALMIGNNANVATGPGIFMANAVPIYGRSGINNWLNLIQMDAGSSTVVGNTTGVTILQGAGAGGGIRVLHPGEYTAVFFPGGIACFGSNDGTAVALSGTIRSANKTGTDAAAPDFNIRSGLGTGTGTVSKVIIQGSVSGSAGTTAHTVADLAQFQLSNTASDTALLIRVNKAGVQTVERVKIGGTNTGPGGSGRALYIDN